MSDDQFPVILPPNESEHNSDVQAVLLAAGMSSRFGERNKLVQSIDEDLIIRQAAKTLLAADLSTTVVLGHDADRIREVLSDLSVSFRVNNEYETGQGTSVKIGTQTAIQNEADAVIVALGDMPNVSVSSVQALITTYECHSRSALASAYMGQRGNPVLFDQRHFDSLTEQQGDTGGRSILFETEDTALVETNDPGVVYDINTPSDMTG